MGGAIISAPGAGVLELDSHLHHASTLHHHQQTLSHHLQGLAPLSTTQHLNASQDSEQSLGFESKGTPNAALICSKVKSAGTSDEDEPSFTEEGDCHLGGKGKRGSPWQRMKWTDSMVKLLISVVLLVGEDGTVDCADGNKRKSGILQKKGKWKSVSRVMNERGCYVSPQQCEDKFNDLNKRFKRLNDILGKNTARCVVENPSLLDTMENLCLKTKDDVKKILSSKHLFYKEMCSYHSGCKSLLPADFEFQPSIQAGIMSKGRDCMEMTRSMRGENDMDEDEEDDAEEDEEDDYDDHDDENVADIHIEAASDLPSPFGKRRKSLKYINGLSCSLLDCTKTIGLEPLNMDLMSMIQDGVKLTAEQSQFIRIRTVQLEEQKVNLQAQALELEKQHFKWQKFSSRKERELERMRLDNKKMELENERRSLQLREKELERSEVSMNSIDVIMDRLQSKEQIDSGREQGLGQVSL